MISAATSVLVRYLVGSPPDQAARAARLIDASERLGVPLLALGECAHVLRTQYGVGRTDVVNALIGLVRRENVQVLGLDTDDATDALLRARAIVSCPIPDALTAVQARATRALPLYTFDRGLSRIGVPVAEP